MDLTSVIASFKTGDYTVTRSGPTTCGSDGIADAPSTSTFSIEACVQPVTGRDLQRLPEGLRGSEIRAVFTPTQLKTQGAGQDPDSIAIDGEAWQVQKVEPWVTLGAFWKALVLKTGN